METQGTFNTVRFYETLAMILSKKHGVEITVKVKEKPKIEETALGGRNGTKSNHINADRVSDLNAAGLGDRQQDPGDYAYTCDKRVRIHIHALD